MCKHTTEPVLEQCKAVVCHSNTRPLRSLSCLMHRRGKAMACDHPSCNKLPSSGIHVAHNGTQPLLGIHVTAGSNTGLGAQWDHVQLPRHLPSGCSSCHRSCPHQQIANIGGMIGPYLIGRRARLSALLYLMSLWPDYGSAGCMAVS